MNSIRSNASSYHDGSEDSNMPEHSFAVNLNDDRWQFNDRVYNFLGARFMALDMDQTVTQIERRTLKDSFEYLVTPNVDHLVRMWKQPDIYFDLYDGAWLSVCDSRILEILAKISGRPLSPVPGSDLTANLFENYIKADETVNVIGGDENIIAIMKDKFGLTKLNWHNPPMGLKSKPDEIAKCAKFIEDNPARYTFICVGSPQQELVARACVARGKAVGLGLCVGASLEFLTGRVKRAPKWMQKSRLEWLHRLLSEPKRMWKRYLVEGPKIFYIWLKWSLGARPSHVNSKADTNRIELKSGPASSSPAE